MRHDGSFPYRAGSQQISLRLRFELRGQVPVPLTFSFSSSGQSTRIVHYLAQSLFHSNAIGGN